MTKTTLAAWALTGALSLGTGVTALAQDDNNALIDALVKKKVLTEQEADDVRADMVKENAQTASNKISISNSVSELRLYGDFRMRDQLEDVDYITPNTTTGYANHQDRLRFRLRLNADITLQGGWFGGVQLQTNNASDSGNQTFGNPPGYQNYGIYISRAFFGWHNDWFTGIAGKQANPFYTTDLVWDPDINPEGFTESLSIDKLLAGASLEQATGYTKDGKTVTTSTGPAQYPWSLTLVTGQLIYNDNDEATFPGGGAGKDGWQFVEQLIGTYKITPDLRVTFAPGYSIDTDSLVTVATNDSQPFYNATSTTTNGLINRVPVTQDLSIVTAPGDVSFNLWGIQTKALWDFAYNTDGRDRFTRVLEIPEAEERGKDSRAWLAGLSFGQNVSAGDWSIFANYRQVGIAAIDPNENDSDFALSYMNTEGVKVGVAYNVTDFAVAALTWYDAVSMGGLSGGEATHGFDLANASSVQILQLDFNVKF